MMSEQMRNFPMRPFTTFTQALRQKQHEYRAAGRCGAVRVREREYPEMNMILAERSRHSAA